MVIGGFQNIIEYLRRRSAGEWDLDSDIADPKHRADTIAYDPQISLSPFINPL